jgi:5-methylthioadenosine/S-adenosylhomocysteine deaminase
MVDGVIRKRRGQLIGYDLESIRAKAKTGLQRTMANLSNFQPEMTEREMAQFLLDTERLTRANLAGAYGPQQAITSQAHWGGSGFHRSCL